MSDTHMNRACPKGHMLSRSVRGQVDWRTIGIIIVMMGLAAILFMITKGMFNKLG